MRVFNMLKLADVPGNPTLEEAAGDWFRDIVRALFGSWDDVTKERYIREIFALVPKKNSKTSYGAGLMLTALILNERPLGKFLLVAPTQDVTDLAFSQCKGMIELDKFLSTRFHIQSHIKKITDRWNGATLEIMSFDPTVLTGQKPTGFLVDELHVVAGLAKAQSAVGQLRGGMIAQPEAFGLFITTQSEKPPAGVFKAELDVARAVRDGSDRLSRTLPILYEFPESISKTRNEWQNTNHWRMVIPNDGRSITVERLIEEFAGAQRRGEEEIRRWASQHLNIEVGLALQSDRWAGADLWEDEGDSTLDLTTLLTLSEVVVCGIDGGGMDDLMALGVLGRHKITHEWLFWVKAWAHPIVLKRRKDQAGPLMDFAASGDLTIVPHVGADIDELVSIVQLVDNAGLLAHVGLDPMGIGAIVDALAAIGVEDDRVVGIPQGWQLAGAIKTAERKLADHTYVHANQSIMAWAIGNAKVEPRGNAITITKQASGNAKIDPLMAMFNCVALMSRNPEALFGPSIYETRGLLRV